VRRFLQIILLGMILSVSLIAHAQDARANNSISFGATFPPYLNVTYTRANVLVLNLLEVDVSARLTIDPQTEGIVSLTPLANIGWYEPNWNIVLEWSVPKGIVPHIGESTYGVYLSGTYRW